VSLVVQGGSGSITVPSAVLAEIASRAAESVDGVHVRRRRSVDLEASAVKLGLAARRGESLMSVGERVQEQVAAAFQTMCGLDLTVEVAFEELT
jgi:uncharacterized alkaline shock family protein YloU